MAKRTPRTDSAPAVPEIHRDGWANILTAVGTARDQRTAGVMEVAARSVEHWEALWRGGDMAARIVERPIEEMVRRGFSVAIPGDASSPLSDSVMAEAERLNVLDALAMGAIHGRWSGGGAVLVGAQDGQTPDRPLDIERVVRLDYLTPLDRREIFPLTYYNDPLAPHFGLPETYQVQAFSAGVSSVAPQVVHASRVIRFDGVRTTSRAAHSQQGWGDSVLLRPEETLRDFGLTWASVSIILQRFNEGVHKMDGLANLMLTKGKEGEQIIAQRMGIQEMMASILKTRTIDGKDEFDRHQAPVSGLEGLLVQFFTRLAAAADMPATILVGQSPSGLNATGASDVRNWYDRVSSQRTKTLGRPLRFVLELIMRTLRAKPPKGWAVEWPPLWEMTDLEAAEMRLKHAQADELAVTGGWLLPHHIAAARFAGPKYGADIRLTAEQLAEVQEHHAQAVEMAAAAAAPEGDTGEDGDDAGAADE